MDHSSEPAATYEGEGQNGLAEQALRWSYDRGGGAGAALELAKHYGRRALDADALRWCDVAARDAAGTPIAVEAAARAEELRKRVDSADRLAEQLVQVAESKQDRARFSAYVLDRKRTGDGVEMLLQARPGTEIHLAGPHCVYSRFYFFLIGAL